MSPKSQQESLRALVESLKAGLAEELSEKDVNSLLAAGYNSINKLRCATLEDFIDAGLQTSTARVVLSACLSGSTTAFAADSSAMLANSASRIVQGMDRLSKAMLDLSEEVRGRKQSLPEAPSVQTQHIPDPASHSGLQATKARKPRSGKGLGLGLGVGLGPKRHALSLPKRRSNHLLKRKGHQQPDTGGEEAGITGGEQPEPAQASLNGASLNDGSDQRTDSENLQQSIPEQPPQAGPSVPATPQEGSDPLAGSSPVGSGQGRVGMRTCRACSYVVGELAPLIGHSCVEYLISKGMDPQKYEHSMILFKPDHHLNMSKEFAEDFLQRKLSGAQYVKKRRLALKNQNGEGNQQQDTRKRKS